MWITRKSSRSCCIDMYGMKWNQINANQFFHSLRFTLVSKIITLGPLHGLQKDTRGGTNDSQSGCWRHFSGPWQREKERGVRGKAKSWRQWLQCWSVTRVASQIHASSAIFHWSMLPLPFKCHLGRWRDSSLHMNKLFHFLSSNLLPVIFASNTK